MSEPTTPVADAASEGSAPSESGPSSGGGWGWPAVMILICMVAVAVIVVSVVKITGDRHDKGETVVFVVPEGTARKAALGQSVDIMPPRVELHVGDSISVRNEDSETASVGPFTVRPGETVTQQFENPQVLKGECSLSGSGEITIIVT